MSTKSFAYFFTSLRLNQQLNKYISLTYKSQHNTKSFSNLNLLTSDILLKQALGTLKGNINVRESETIYTCISSSIHRILFY
jgi:hypothetical protein